MFAIFDKTARFSDEALGALGFRVFTTFLAEFTRVRGDTTDEHRVFRLDHHLHRLTSSAASLSIAEIPIEPLRKAVLAAIRSRAKEKISFIVKIVIAEEHCSILVDTFHRSLPNSVRLKSVAIDRGLPEHKTTSGASSTFARKHAQHCGADEALLINSHGLITEGAWSNFF